MALSNVNPETGIRYGIVSLNSLADWVSDEFFQNGVNDSFESALAEWESEGNDPDEFDYEGDEDSYSLETPEGLKLGLSTLGGAYNVWVFESPHVANHGLCSPCVPNCGNIDTPGDFECYTLPAEWFNEGRK